MGETDSFAALLKRYRVAAGLSQEALAERAEMSTRAISDLERGFARHPYPHTVRRLVQALHLDEAQAASFRTAAGGLGEAAAAAIGRPAQAIRDSISVPSQPTSFIGRRQEVEEIRAAFYRGAVRLLTLTGPGGVGKTRLALRIAEELADAFPDGAVFVSLASLADPGLVASTVAGILQVRQVSGRPVLESLIEHLREKRLLLVVDNFEHLLPAADVLSQILTSCPRLTILVTSRAVVHLTAEHEYPVPPFPVPTPRHQPDLEALARYDAIQLFLQRAQAVKPGFRMTRENAAATAEICWRLDGLPLAIELAAARIRIFPPALLLQRLTDRLQLLTGGPRDVSARQQTLRNTIDWSYCLLLPEEQQLFARLSVFAGGCTLAAVEEVCNSRGELNLLAGITSLVEQSLLTVEEEEGEPRFRMLETIREYAAERLDTQAGAAEIRQQHADYFALLASRGETCRGEDERRAWLDRIESEHDNIRAALRWLVASDRESALRMAIHLSGFLYERWHFTEGQRWLEEALAAATNAPAILRTQALRGACTLAFHHGDYDASERFAEENLLLARESGDDLTIADGLLSLAPPIKDRGEHDRAEQILDEALALFRACGNVHGVMRTLHLLGEVALNRGDYGRAVEVSGKSVALARDLGDRRFLIMALDNLARALLCHGDPERAALLWIEGAHLSVEYGDRTYGVYYLEGLAGIAAREGRAELAARLAGAAAAVRDEIHEPASGPEAEIIECFLAPARDRLDGTCWETAWTAGQGMTFEQAVSHALSGLRDR